MIKLIQRFWLPVTMFAAIAATAQAQTAQPYLTSIAPNGAKRGGKVTLTVEGFNLTDASEVIWSKPGLTSTIILNSELAREAPRPSKDPTKKLAGDRGVRIRDVREAQGERYAYRLSIHEPSPDFVLFAEPENPNIPRGGSLPITITAYRADQFDGEINVKLADLPVGFAASTGVIRSGENSTVIMVSAANDASASFPLRVQVTATVNGQTISRELKTEERIAIVSVAPPPELLVWTEPAQVVLEPGGHAFVTIKIKRERGFEGRVPFDVRNLPHGVIVTDVGLNGVMITEEEITQRFRLAAESWVKPMKQPVFVVGRIETASPQRSDFPAKPFTLIIQF